MPAEPAEVQLDLLWVSAVDRLGERAHRVTSSFVQLLAAAGHINDMPAISSRVAELAATTRDKVVAEVQSAFELDPGVVSRLEESLSRVTGSPIEAKVVVDPDLIGGIVARVGDTVYDGSVLTRLRKLREDVQKV